MPDLTGVPEPPIEWTEEYRKTNFALVANATLSALVEPTQHEREHAAMAATILHLGARLEALEACRGRREERRVTPPWMSSFQALLRAHGRLGGET